jgi:hypothetical protein
MNVACFKFPDKINKTFHTPPKPIKLPDDERIAFSQMG